MAKLDKGINHAPETELKCNQVSKAEVTALQGSKPESKHWFPGVRIVKSKTKIALLIIKD